ncbi:MAG: two-component regulator propeller domain-containing protein [Verrucomicrobiae bacterium]|nr:two-component regulator propeller domain-containing protein [Verrucomicrobiae bacterium]
MARPVGADFFRLGFIPRFSGPGFVQLLVSLILLPLCTSSPGRDSSQLSEYQTTIWRVEDGLPQSTVTCIAQSAEGYLWLGTQNGLVRFDGVKFRVFDENNTPAFQNSRIVRLLCDQEGTLWVGTEHGRLVRFRDGQFTAYDVPSRGTTHDYARVFCGDRDGALWQVSCEWQLIQWLQGKFTVLSDNWNLSSPSAHALACDVAGRIWVGTDRELAVLKDGQFQPQWGRTNEENFQVDFLAPCRTGGVWVAANGRLRKFDAGHWTVDLGAYAWTNRPIYDLYEDHEQRLWVATLGGGLFRYDAGGGLLHLTSQSGLPTDFVRSVMEDREGNIWAGTEGGGLCRLKPALFQTYGVAQGLASDQVMAVAEARDGGMWIGTDGDGLDHWQDGKIQHYGLREGLGNGHVWSVLQDRSGTVWAGTWDGLYKWQDGTFNGLSDGQTIGWQVLAMYENRAGDLWLGQQAFGGITRLRDGERTVVKIPETSANLDVRTFIEDHDTNLWVGTSEDGLYRLRDGNVTHFGRKDGLGSDSIWCLYVDPAGVLWVGTCRGGLSRWADGHFTTWTTQNGLLNNVICQIMEDAQGNLWLGSYGGIFRINKQELNASASRAGQKIHCIGYNAEDGLPSLECQGGFQPSGYKSADGRLWFPTIKGLVVVDPAKVHSNASPPNVVIEAILADGLLQAATNRSDRLGISPLPETTIPAGNQHLEFQYTALSFVAPKEVHFKCRLEGLEQDWEDTGAKRTVEYRHVPPGHYQFRVIAGNGDGVWNEAGASAAIVVLPYFWETKWFLAANALAGLALVVSIARYSERRWMQRRLERVERERAVEKERSRIAQDIHDELGANLTEIAMLSEFAQEPTASPAQVHADMQKITAKARNLTQMMDEVVWAVTPQNDSLEKFVTYTCSFAEEYLLTAKIACRLEVPAILPEFILSSDVRHNLFLTVKEALNNVVKHSRATEVRIQVALDSGNLILTVRDNGRGFVNPPAPGPGPEISGGEQHDGLQNMRRRLANISGQLELASRPGSTCIIMVLPLGGATTNMSAGNP